MNPSVLFNRAGGLRYHLRARRYSNLLWQPFRLAIGDFVMGFTPAATTLLLVGPSGGYCLPAAFFERFERVVCLEPDPIARLLFRRKLDKASLERRPRLEFIAEDHLLLHPERLPRLAASLGDTALLFSNIIGQLRGLLDVDEPTADKLRRVRDGVAQAIEGRAFASFHDRLSGAMRPEVAQPFRAQERMSDDAILSQFYTPPRIDREPHDTELFDHLTEGFFPRKSPHTYFVWQLLPRRYHLIEGIARSELS
jgi:hypothetical protein